MKYRPEVDGLRAVAVLSVIFFHAGFLPGGFVGVDLFFVISGYLITTILIEDIENKRFSFVNFYKKRAQRLLPALFLMFLIVSPFAWLLKGDEAFFNYLKELISSLFFVSNIYFWHHIDYFNPIGHENLLLHLWSLGVEEQFYIFFPIFIFVLFKFKDIKVVTIATFSIILASLLLAVWAQDEYAMASFYLIPTRAWELGFGSISALLLRRYNFSRNTFLASIGFWLIVFSIFFFDKFIAWPSLYTILPTLGIVLIILFHDKKSKLMSIFNNTIIINIGKISYSAYLYHWPILGIFYLLGANIYIKFVAIFLTFFISFLSYKYVELPFRYELTKRKFILGIGATLGAISIFIFLILTNPKPNHLANILEPEQPYLQRSDCFIANSEIFNFAKCFKNYNKDKYNIVVIGDSHAASIYPGLIDMSPDGVNIYQLTYTGCVPNIGMNRIKNLVQTNFVRTSNSDECQLIKNSISKQLKTLQPDIVMISSHHAAWVTNFHESSKGSNSINFNTYFVALEETLGELKDELNASRIVIVGQLPLWSPSLPTIFNSQYALKLLGYDFDASSYASIDVIKINQRLKEIAENLKYKFINPVSLFCENLLCTGIGPNGSAISHDYGHLSLAGSEDFAEYFFDALLSKKNNF